MTLTELVRDGGSGSSSLSIDSLPTAKPRWRWPLLVAGAVVVALVVMSVLADTYQPLQFGGESGIGFPGLPHGSGARQVNNYGGATGEVYIPPQRTVFTILESIQNSGPEAVTIEAVSLVPPSQMPPSDIHPWPLRAAGQVLYMPEYYARGEYLWKIGRPVLGLSLSPNQAILVGIPARMAGACYVPGSSTGTSVFYVEEGLLTFTKWVALPVGTPLIMREPEPPSRGSGLVCPK